MRFLITNLCFSLFCFSSVAMNEYLVCFQKKKDEKEDTVIRWRVETQEKTPLQKLEYLLFHCQMCGPPGANRIVRGNALFQYLGQNDDPKQYESCTYVPLAKLAGERAVETFLKTEKVTTKQKREFKSRLELIGTKLKYREKDTDSELIQSARKSLKEACEALETVEVIG